MHKAYCKINKINVRRDIIRKEKAYFEKKKRYIILYCNFPRFCWDVSQMSYSCVSLEVVSVLKFQDYYFTELNPLFEFRDIMFQKDVLIIFFREYLKT